MLVDLRPGLRTYLLGSSEIAAMVSGRVFPVRMSEGNRLDCVVFIRVLDNESYTMQSPSHLIGSRFQIDSWSQDQDRAARLGDLVKERLGGASGVWPYGASSPTDVVIVQGVFLQTGFEDFDEEAQLYRVSRDFIIWYEDA